MKEQKKQKNLGTKKLKTIDQEFEELIHQFLEMTLDQRKQAILSGLESVDQVKERVEIDLRVKIRTFCDQFIKGYNALLDEARNHPRK